MDRLIELKIRNLLTDEEFLGRKSILNAELATLQGKRSEHETRTQNWREVAEQVFNFATFAIDNFRKGDPKKKKEIFISLGQNHSLKDQKLSLELYKWLKVIKKENNEIEKEVEMLEPKKNRTVTTQNGTLRTNSLKWYAGEDSNLQALRHWCLKPACLPFHHPRELVAR